MKKTLLLAFALYCGFASAQNFVFDPSFSDDGYDVTNYFQYYDNDQGPREIHHTPDRIILCQKTQVSAYTHEGLPDYAFGDMAIRRLTIPGQIAIAGSKIIDGHIIVYGRTYTVNTFDAFVAKIDLNGNLDPSFGNNGVFTYPLGDVANESLSDGISDLVEHNGNYYGVGTRLAGNPYYNTFVVKIDPSGHLDTTFGTGGLHSLSETEPNRARRIFNYQNNLLIVSTMGFVSMNVFTALDESGNLIAGFGSGGTKRITDASMAGFNLSGNTVYVNCDLFGPSPNPMIQFKSFNINNLAANTPMASVPAVVL